MDQNNTPGFMNETTPNSVNNFGSAGTPSGAPVATPESPKSKKGLKIGLITGASLLLAGGIGGGVYAYIHTLPENILLGAVSNLLNTENIQLSGSILATPAEKSDIFQDLRIELSEGTSKNGEVTAGATVKIIAKVLLGEETKEVSVTTDEVFVKDGVLYLKISGLRQALDNILKIAIASANNSVQTNCVNSYASMGMPTTNCASRQVTEADIPQELNLMLSALVGTIEGQWWKISIDELASIFGGSLTSSVQSDIKEAYQCVLSQLHSELNKSNQYAELFKKNTFATIEKANNVKMQAGDAYELKIDTEKAKAYFEEARKIVDVNAFSACAKSLGTNAEVSTIEKEVGELTMPKIYLGIAGWNPQIVSTQIFYDNEESSTAVDLKLSYPTKIDYSAPSDAKSVTELVNQLTPLFDML